MVNTIALMLGFFQIGLLNGGYRIIALRDTEQETKTNNVIMSYFGSLFLLATFGFIVVLSLGFLSNGLVVFISILMGLLFLVNNWYTNILIAAQEYTKLNIANSVSALASIFCVILASYYGLYGALFSLLIQPLLLIIIVIILYKKALPTRFILDVNHMKYVLSFGFVPFLSGVFALIYMQLERWSIITFLGQEELGKLYIVFLLTTLWSLIPGSINSLYFPKSVLLAKNGNYAGMFKIIKQYFLVIILYSLIGVTGILLFMKPILGQVFPAHVPYIHLAYILTIGLVLKILVDPITLLLNSVVKLKPIFHSDLFSIIVYAGSVLLLVVCDIFSLENILFSFAIYNLIRFVYLFIYYYYIKKSLVTQ